MKYSTHIFVLLLSMNLIAHQIGCSRGISGTTGLSGPGLTLLPQTDRTQLVMPSASPSSSIVTLDTDSMTPAGTWVSVADASREVGSGYQYFVTTGGLGSVTGNITLTSSSYLLLVHQVRTDSSSLAIEIDSVLEKSITAGASNDGWVVTPIKALTAGTYALSITTNDAPGKFAYADGFIAIPTGTVDQGLQAEGWFEQDHAHVRTTGSWSTNAVSTTFPYSVTTTSGTGTLYTSSTNSSVWMSISVSSASTLKVWSQKGPDLGELGVNINEVGQSAFDLYASSTSFREAKEYSLGAGTHLIELYYTGNKNASSSGTTIHIDALQVVPTLTDDERALRFANSISGNIQGNDGEMRIAFDSQLYNQDNDVGYSLMALALAARAWNYQEHVDALKKNLQWFANVISNQGYWYWGYCKEGESNCPRNYIESASGANCINGFCPSVNSYYSGLSPAISAIRSVDAAQSVPLVALALFNSLYPEEKAFVNSVLNSYIAGIDRLITDNYDSSNGFFYSSYQFKEGSWQLYEQQYAAGQCDVYMGLMSAYSLTGLRKYKTMADHIKTHFDSTFYDSTRKVYTVGLSGPKGGAKTMDQTNYYPFAQGWCVWVLGPNNLAHSDEVIASYKSWIEGDTYSVKSPSQTESESSSSAWLMLALQANSSDSSTLANLKERARQYQFLFQPDTSLGYGGVGFSQTYYYLYTSNSAWSLMSYLAPPPPSSWWK